MPLAGAAAALELGAHLGAHHHLLPVGICGQDGQVEEVDKGGMGEALLQLLLP
jgi:hypothetical protein